MNETKLSSSLPGVEGMTARVRRACMRYVQNRDEADDLAQEVLIKVFRRGALASERAWWTRVTANHCLDHLRRQKRQRLSSAAYALELGLERRWEEPAEADGRLEELRERLNEADRRLLDLRCGIGLTQAQIAEILGVTRVRIGQTSGRDRPPRRAGATGAARAPERADLPERKTPPRGRTGTALKGSDDARDRRACRRLVKG